MQSIKKWSSFFIVVIMSFLISACEKTEGSETSKTVTPKSDLKIGVVLTMSGKGDKSFNDSALVGLENAKKDFGITYKSVQPKTFDDFESSIELLAKEKHDIIFTVDFTSAKAIQNVAAKYPDTKFVIIDYSFGDETLPNVKGIVFKSEEGSYLAGALAASLSNTNVVGFVGGMDSEPIQKFEAGYKAGVLAIKPDAKILVSYISDDPSGFNNIPVAKEISLDMISKKADIIYQASGGSGLGVLEAVSENNILAIGVDSNQNWLKPGFVVASMLKRVDNAVYQIISKSLKDELVLGNTDLFGINENAVGLTNLSNLTEEETIDISGEDQQKIKDVKSMISEEIKIKIDQLKKDIIDKKIEVPSIR